MNTKTLTLLMIITALPVMADHHAGNDHGKHQMLDGTWMDNEGMNGATASEPVKKVQMTGKRVTGAVNGLVCDFCAQGIKKSLMKNAEVADVQVDLSAKTVVVAFKGGKVIDEATLKTMLKDAGYDMTGYKVE